MKDYIKHHESNNTFYIDEDGKEIGKITYTIHDGAMNINHTYVDPDYRSHGYAKQLVIAGVELAKSKQLKLRPTCSYAYKVVDENYPDLLIRS